MEVYFPLLVKMKNSLFSKKSFNTIPAFLRGQEGFTLMELVVMIVLLGVAIPSIISLYSQLSATSVKSSVLDQMMFYAEAKMEEVIAIKEKNLNWYQTPNQFAEDVNLPDDFHRTVTVQNIQNWGNVNISAVQVTVDVTHPLINNSYTLTVRLTPYDDD